MPNILKHQTREPEEGMEEWNKLVQDSIQTYGKNHDNEMNKMNAPITQDEIRKAIKQLKSNKTCGPHQIPNEIFINGGNETIKDLHIVFIEIFRTETIPNEWKNAGIVSIYKGIREE